MVDPARARRLAKRVSEIVATAIDYEIKDPGLVGVTIVDAKLSGDLHDATLYYTVIGSTLNEEPDYQGAAAALERAKGVLRSKVGAGTGVRFTPTLTFTRDTVSDSVHRMEELLARARAADADVARVREGATPAGDADPYRVSGDDDGEHIEQIDTPDYDSGRPAARGGAGQSEPGAPTTNGEGAGDDDQLKD
jgi:ribosome-binding factor A